eukprot:jgi/Hompol1/1148/HPOL_001243-RA
MTASVLESSPRSLQEKLDRWNARLAGLTELVLPTDYPRPVPARTIEAEQVAEVSETAALAILQLSLSLKASIAGPSSIISPFSILLAAFSILLHRYTGEEDISIGSSSASFNPLVLRMKLSSSDSIAQVVQAVLKSENDAFEDEVPFSLLLDSLSKSHASASGAHVKSPEGAAASQPPSLFKVRFFNLTDTTAETLSSTTTSSSCDLTVLISQSVSLRRLLPIQIRLVYNSVLFSAGRISDMLLQLQQLLETTAANLAMPIGQISLVTPSSKLVLPNPLADLGWDDFHGAITDIFAANARRHPDRICVVESLSPFTSSSDKDNDASVSERSFTYHQINSASNAVAHHLLSHGIQREDVVVLYSHRGVDLVVAIMGVLKAGATFSVIDPAYPPPRQIVYLSVAQPRALIFLARAGVLDQSVRDYIDTTLSIVCELPGLQLLSNGTPYAADSLDTEQRNLLEHALDKADSDPNVELGPDSIGTLSFTSGSTGTPKGVRGRHYSLTHFYPWMVQEFELSERERFTMLSGIAHDPIQRDIFTPLFLGARLYIPTADHIGSPGRLAEWMASQEITITHLTPAMGQLLSANATHPIPTLRHAFFVGDVLTKRDVLRLQHLAPNTHVINMYGTTETQRAVSFIKIPARAANPAYLTQQKDIIPAGSGMKDVQLLVINASGLLCGVGEIGEIYVRSGGLAEGYLALPDVTNIKFISNPFNPTGPAITATGKTLPYYHGPRDRMYRTGDLGRYKPDGSVECTGRADDQVKIRGYRIELGEIDTHLSQHASVRENVTLVRRDKYEEMTLVTYFVPLASDESIGDIVKDIRNYLKQKLPIYAVPTVFVPLTRMPLTPNGKVDKNALPFPDTALAAALVSETSDGRGASLLSPMQKCICDVWSKLLGILPESIGLSDSFFDLGGHSILATRLIFELRKILAIDVPLGMVYQAPTLEQMATEIDQIRGGDLGIASTAISTGDSTDINPSSLSKTKSVEALGREPADTRFDYASDLDIVDEPTLAAGSLAPFDFSILAGNGSPTFLLTGVTGFLGTFILESVLNRFPGSRVICLVRAPSDADALARIIKTATIHLTWNPSWKTDARVEALAGDLGSDNFGLSDQVWNDLSNKVDVIIHNGALVHWVYPYSKLRNANVLGTKTALRLATTNRLKPLHFVSSTSVLDTEEFVRKLDLGQSVSEQDDLEGA